MALFSFGYEVRRFAVIFLVSRKSSYKAIQGYDNPTRFMSHAFQYFLLINKRLFFLLTNESINDNFEI